MGSEFDVVALLTAIGAGIGLLSVATLIADFIATRCLRNKHVYRQAKYNEIEVEDEEDELERIKAEKIAAIRAKSERKLAIRAASQSNLATPLRGPGGNEANSSDGKLHIAEQHESSSDDDEEVESWGKARYPKIHV